MVDIIIGAIPPAGPPSGKLPLPGGGHIEAQILNVRQGRKHACLTVGEEKRKQFRCDPPGSKVLTIMVSDGTSLPDDLDGRRYSLQLRFRRK
ncbi:MAG: hypothetical protein OEV64_09900 [Desulfobulbaceae bacterium]|nr:hypothetical protein [Desulfobulbaceae bacterium]